MIIGLSGYATAGKDEVAKVLVDVFQAKKYAFADKLRDCLLALNPIVYWDETGIYNLARILADNTWDQAKMKYPEVRRLLQRLGTEVGRDIINPNLWADLAIREICNDGIVADESKLAVISDVRFMNEVMRIKTLGGKIWRINRPYVGPKNNHSSETSLDNYQFDEVIYNDGSLENLHNTVLVKYAKLLLKLGQ